MKSRNLLIGIAIATAVPFTSVNAADGTINFTGSITDTACKVDTSSASQTVNLGTISSTSFGAAGATAAPTRFTINLTSCPAAVKSASVRFDGATANGNNAILGLSSGQTATNVGVGIYEQDSTTLIPVGSASSSKPLSTTATNSLTYIAKYVATATPVTAGSANSSAAFTIAYN
ncbi:fimbrial protein [Pantoea ananatis]|nr:fimbrial protein [Pantoea ananatis]MBA4823475.1 fimbrial protein [Pantoea ananatis]QKV90230.1 fimbrial protein [Pantoea ananatis]